MKFRIESVPLHTLPIDTFFKTELAVDDPQPNDPVYRIDDKSDSPTYIDVVEIANGQRKNKRLIGSMRVCAEEVSFER